MSEVRKPTRRVRRALDLPEREISASNPGTIATKAQLLKRRSRPLSVSSRYLTPRERAFAAEGYWTVP